MKKLSVDLYKEKTTRPTYTPSAEEKVKLNRLESDFSDMIKARSVIDKDRPIYQRMLDAIPKVYQDDRSSSTVPLATALVELFVSKATKIQTEFFIKWDSKRYKKPAAVRQAVWDNDWRVNNRVEEIIDMEYTRGWFGYAVLRTGYEVEVVDQYELQEVKADGEIVWDKETITDEKIILENIDIRNFYLDNNATKGLKNAKKCMIRKRMGYDEFLDLKNNKLYKNIEYVRPRNYSANYMPYNTREEISREGKFVEIREYWNLTGDTYCVWANGIIIREHHIMNTVKGRKVLPFTLIPLGKKINRYDTGRWLCEAVLKFNSQINDLNEMIMDLIRSSNSPTIVIGNWLTFNGRKFSFDNEVLEFDWDINTWFKELTGTPPNQAIFNQVNNLFEQIAVFVGIDIKNILWVPQQTAYQTNVQVESSRERVNVWLTNRDLALERMANQHMENLVRFFPRKTAEWLFPELEISDYELTEDETGIMWKQWSSWLVQITPELLEWDTYIDVYTNVSRPPSDIANRQSKLEFAQALWTIVQAYATAQQAWIDMSFIPAEAMIKELADEHNLESIITLWADEEQLTKQSNEFREKLSSMMTWWLPQLPQGWEQQMQPQQAPSTQPNLPPNFWPWQIS